METIDQVLVQGYRGWVARAALVLRRWYGIINNPISMRIVALLLLLALALANTCGGCCPSNLCPGCPCGTKTNVVDIPTWCAKHNWSQTCCKCIVVHESAGDANGQDYNTDKTYDIGLWQINQVTHILGSLTGPAMQASHPAT